MVHDSFLAHTKPDSYITKSFLS